MPNWLPAAFLFFAISLTALAQTGQQGNQSGPQTGGGANAGEEDVPTYKVVDGRVDENTLNGYIRYTANCAQCHGQDGLGSTFAPSLLRPIQRLGHEGFLTVIANGLQVRPGFVMPAFGTDPNVWPHVDDIWRYLKARSDGALGRGRPQLLAEADETGEPDAPGQAEAAAGAKEKRTQ